jgi:MtaA/CmuA family methyltransferase
MKSMTPSERLAARMRCDAVDRIPNMSLVMQFSADNIGIPLSRFYQDYHVLCEAKLRMVDDYQLDLVDTISDPYREAADFGSQIIFPENDLPLCTTPLLADTSDLTSLPLPDPLTPGSRMCDRVDSVRLFHERVGGTVPVQGWIEGALAEAADLRGVSAIMYDLYDRPEWMTNLLEHCTRVAIDFALAQIEAGATIIGLGDAIASQVGPNFYRQFALPYEQRIFEAIKKAGAIPRLHICGDTTSILEDMAQSGTQILDLDWQVDLEKARSVVDEIDPDICLCGNFDPVAVLYEGTPEEVTEATLHCRAAGGENWLAQPGCEVPRNTPSQNLRAFSDALIVNM